MSEKLLKITENTRFYKDDDGEIYRIKPEDIRVGDVIFVDEFKNDRREGVDHSVRMGVIDAVRLSGESLMLNSKEMMCLGTIKRQNKISISLERELERERV